jgi:CRP/FNR family cyclic AMP-dependent transcriptional regulator
LEITQEVHRLSQVPMFSKLDESKLKLLAFTSKLLEYQDNDLLFKEGDPADSVYLVLDGEVDILVGEESIIVRGENALIGEMAVISKQGRSASVRAKGAVVAMRIEGDVFLQLLTSNAEAALDVMKQLSDKLTEAHHANTQLQEQLNAFKK